MMYVVVNKYLVPQGYSALTIFPFIFVGDGQDKDSAVLINHERIHLQQQAELLILPFFIWYLAEYLLRLLQYGSHDKAYRNISFEREAYGHEENLHYLKKRQWWAFIKHIKTVQ